MRARIAELGVGERVQLRGYVARAELDALYAGATVKAGHVERNDEANFILYNTSYTMPELLYSDWVTPPADVQPLMSYIEQLAP